MDSSHPSMFQRSLPRLYLPAGSAGQDIRIMFEPPRNEHSLNVVARSFEINQSRRLGGARRALQ